MPHTVDLLRDLRYALRTVNRYPVFAVSIIATLALVIGANALVFSVVNAILLRPLPYPDADRLVWLVEHLPADESPSGRPERSVGMSPEVFKDWRQRTRTLSHMGIHMPIALTLRQRGEPVRLNGWRVSASLLPMFEITPALGRLFREDDDRGGASPVVILSYDTWSARFGRDPQVLGAAITLNDNTYTVIGVMPAGFSPFDRPADFWIPLSSIADEGALMRAAVLARIRGGVSLEAAQADADRLCPEVLGVEARGGDGAAAHRIEVVRWKDELVTPVSRTLPMLMGAVTLILLIACVNLGNLFTVHAIRRRHELAVRLALGASRWHLVRQLLIESGLLALLGGAGGLALTVAGTRAIARFGSGLGRSDLIGADRALPRVSEISIDMTMLAYTAGLVLFVAIACSAGALWRARRSQAHTLAVAPTATLPVLQRGAPVLLALQVTLTIVLTAGAFLLIRSFSHLAQVDPGYQAAGVVTFQLAPRADPWANDVAATQTRQVTMADTLIARLRTLPGVEAAAFTSGLPLVEASYMVSISSTAAMPPTSIDQGRGLVVSPDYFRAMGMRIVAGRGFSGDDEQRTSATFVVNQALARRYFGAANPISQHIYLWGIPGDVVGVVVDTHATTLDVAPQPQIFMTSFRGQQFLPILSDGLYFAVRAKNVATLVTEIRSIAREVNPESPIQRVATMDRIVASSLTMNRGYALVVGVLAFGALVLVAVGLYGVIAHLVGQRTHEIAIRVAIGASRRDVLRLVLRNSMTGVLAGIGAGLPAAWLLAPSLRGLLFGVGSFDPWTFVFTPVLVLIVASTASALSARRALKIQPMAVLRAN